MRRWALLLVVTAACSDGPTAPTSMQSAPITETVTADISGGEGPCDPHPACRTRDVVISGEGEFSARLEWRDRDTWLWLEVWRREGTESGRRIAQSLDFPRDEAPFQTVSARVSPGTYRIVVAWYQGARITPFTLTYTRPT